MIHGHNYATWELKILKFSNFGQNHISDFETPFSVGLRYQSTYVWAIYLLVRARRMEKDAFRRSLCTVVYVTCHVRSCCNLHLTSPTRHLYVVCTYLVLGTYSSSVRGRGLNQYWWPPKDHHSLLVLLRKTKFTFKSRKTLFAILLCIR